MRECILPLASLPFFRYKFILFIYIIYYLTQLPVYTIIRTLNGAPLVWAGPVGPAARVAGVRAGLAFGRKTGRGSCRSGAGDRVLGDQAHCGTLLPTDYGRHDTRSDPFVRARW